MRYRLVPVALLVLGAACTTAPPPSDPPAVAEGAIVAFFDALSATDFDAFRASVTADFEIVEALDGEVVFDAEGFVSYVEAVWEGLEGSEAGIVYSLSDFNTEVSGDVAWTRYRNHGVFTVDGEATHLEWLETAVMQKVDGVWLVDRLHSMPMPQMDEPEGQ